MFGHFGASPLTCELLGEVRGVTTMIGKTTGSEEKSSAGQRTSGADVVVQTMVNFGVDTVFAYPGGASMPLHQALTRFRDKIRVVPPAARARRRIRRSRLCSHDRQSGSLLRDKRARSHQSAHGNCRREARQRPDGRHQWASGHAGDRHRRLSGNAHHRSLPQRDQAPLSGHRPERPGPGGSRGLSYRHDRSARPGADRLAEKRATRPG